MNKRTALWAMALAFLGFLPFLSKSTIAGPGIVPAFQYQTAVSSITLNIVNVSTSATTGATQVDSATLTNRVVLEIQNIDSSANLWCVPVSTTPTTNGGRKIAPGASWIVSSMDTYYTATYSSTTTPTVTNVTSTAKFWCLSDSTVAATKAAVTQAY